MKYFIDDNIWYQGKKQPPRKVELATVVPNPDGNTAYCVDTDGDVYTLPLTEIFETENERKFTDEEVKKALECCGFDEDMCLDCPIQCDCEKDTEAMVDRAKAILDLINRQQAEIARLRMEYTLLEREKAEDICTFANELKNIKAEAYKEIAEIIKQKTLAMVRYDDVLTEDDYIACIDGVVAEMVGESNDKT